MEDSGCSVALSNLICLEDGTRLDEEREEEEEEEEENENSVALDDKETEEDEYIEMLVSREGSLEGSRGQDLSSSDGFSASAAAGDWMTRARSDAIRWILKMKSCFGFRVQTAYLAMNYFDRFFARRTIDQGKSWAIHLASAACLSLAAKMEECRPPALSELQTEEYHFDGNTVQRMELLVLNTLEWRMSPVTPFAYLRHFVSKFPFENERKDVLSRAIGLIFATLEGMSLVEHRPSALAAAAILAASDQRLTKKMVETKMNFISLETEQVFSCYTVMIRESHQERPNPSKFFASSDQSSISSSVDVTATGSFATRSSNKRRRLQLTHIQ